MLTNRIAGSLAFLCLVLPFATAIAQPARSLESKLKPGAVIYGVVPPLFGKQPFRAVTQKLDYLRDQGVDVLWLSPINTSDDPSQISYSVTDHFGLRTDFGSAEDLRGLVRGAHARGMKVMMDIVPNHTSSAHPYHQDIQKNGQASKFYSYYDRDERGEITHYFDWETLLNLNYRHGDVKRMMVNAFKYWIQEFGIDGFRVDAAWGVRERNPEFWPMLSRELTRIKSDVILLAEASARDAYYTSNGFDLAYDWSDRLGEWAWKRAFADPKKISKRLHQALTSAKTSPHDVARFLNNNDTGQRFISDHGLAKTRVAAVLQHTLPGVPIVYTGDEFGAEFDPYQDPEPLAWQDTVELRPFYRKLAELREEVPALHGREFYPAMPKNSGSAYAYFRTGDDGKTVLVVLNFGSAVDLKVPVSPYVKIATVKEADDLLNQTPTPVSFSKDGKLITLTMKASSAVILAL